MVVVVAAAAAAAAAAFNLAVSRNGRSYDDGRKSQAAVPFSCMAGVRANMPPVHRLCSVCARLLIRTRVQQCNISGCPLAVLCVCFVFVHVCVDVCCVFSVGGRLLARSPLPLAFWWLLETLSLAQPW